MLCGCTLVCIVEIFFNGRDICFCDYYFCWSSMLSDRTYQYDYHLVIHFFCCVCGFVYQHICLFILNCFHLSLCTLRWKTGLNMPNLKRKMATSTVLGPSMRGLWSFLGRITSVSNFWLRLLSLRKAKGR